MQKSEAVSEHGDEKLLLQEILSELRQLNEYIRVILRAIDPLGSVNVRCKEVLVFPKEWADR
ncbi:hypothetical protein DRO56_02325 [Candidatus Bathyarchaeota archaeon]|nr:MAG: hypothetical protein DRO56_02325 [Candidatus Bathyarchaeota archaeon]